MNIPAFGAIASPRDYRDEYVASAMAGVTPDVDLPEYFNTELPGAVLDQKQTPSCVSQAMAQLMKLWWFRKTGELVNFSPRFLDTLAKRFDSVDRATGGTYPRLVCKLAAQYGCATIKTVPNVTTLPSLSYRDDSILTKEAFAEAVKYRVPGYVRVNVDKGSLRLGTYLYGAISMLMQIGNEWWVPSWKAMDVSPLRTPKVIVSGHQIVVHGWQDDVFDVLRNSWGVMWGVLGDALFNAGIWRPYALEAWAIAQIPEDVSTFLKSMPSPSAFKYNFKKDIYRGDENEEVKFVQIALMILGYLQPVLPEHLGIYGPKTAAAVLAFQRAQGIATPSANDVGPLTRAQLNSIFWNQKISG